LGDKSAIYYEKYQKEFIKINSERTKITRITNKKEYDKDRVFEEYNNWKSDFQMILKLAETFKINPKLILALGDYDGNDYNAIKSGTHTPAVMEYMYNSRLYIIKSYIRLLIVEYNILRFSYTKKNPKYIQNLIIDSGISHEQIAQLEHNLKSIYDDTFERIQYFQHNKEPHETTEFILQLLANMLLNIYNNNNDKLGNLRQRFVEQFLNMILLGAKLRNKYGYFNFAIVYGEHSEKQASSAELEYGVDSQLDDVDVEDELDPMSLDGYDVDTADIDPSDTDDTGLDIHSSE
jgi:hypothetical protein